MKIHIKKDFGNSGEDIAVQYLKKHGHIILKRNFYCKQGEIDIITKDKNEIVFVEVKSRSDTGFRASIRSGNKTKDSTFI